MASLVRGVLHRLWEVRIVEIHIATKNSIRPLRYATRGAVAFPGRTEALRSKR